MPKIGEQFGNFMVKAEIGKGGMGTIYYAVDTMLNREVALKVIHPELTANAQLMERFKIEAMTQAQMNHPNVVIVFSFNKLDDEFVIAMEYVDGRSLKEILRDRQVLPLQEALHYFKQILRGLDYAHSRKTIHRDIKPANIMITKENQVKISDFGIAKVFGREGLTKTGMLIGTPWYTSPEQILGKDIDFRSDLYSAGITFYEMLTGKVPFDSETNSEFQIQRAHLETPPPRPSIYNTDIDTKIEKFILRTLQKDPEKRFQSAAEMLHELEAIEKAVNETTVVVEGGFQTKMERPAFGRKRRVFPILISIFAGVAVLAAAGYFFIFRKPPPSAPAKPSTTTQQSPATEQGKPDPAAAQKPKTDPGQKTAATGENNGAKVAKTEPETRQTTSTPVQREPKKEPSTEKISRPAVKQPTPTKQKPAQKPSTEVKQKPTGKRVEDTKPSPQSKSKVRPESTTQPAKKSPPARPLPANLDAQMFQIRNLLQNRAFRRAETLGDNLVRQAKTPRVYTLVGAIKFALLKFSQCEAYWSQAIAGNASIPVRVFHKHGIFAKGCSGQLIISKRMVIFESTSRPDHSFAAPVNIISKFSKNRSSAGIEIRALVRGKKRKETFILMMKNNRRKRETFIADFVNKYILGGQ